MKRFLFPRMVSISIFAVFIILGVLLFDNAINKNGVAYALTEAECRSCHGTSLVETHHLLGYSCSYCHVYIWDPPSNAYIPQVINDCTVCHNSASHLAAHDMATTPSADCTQCHSSNVVTEHVTNRNLSCDVCHSSIDPNVQNAITRGKSGIMVYCTDCHTSTVSHTTAHDKATVPSAECTQCHSSNVVTEHVTNRNLACAVCHSSADPVIQNTINLGKSGTMVDCYDCHTSTVSHLAAHDKAGTPYVDCSNCHSVNVVTEHVTNRGFDCNTCHASTNSVVQNVITLGRNGQNVYCASCHTAFGNHTVQHDKTSVPSSGCSGCHQSNVVTAHEVSKVPVYCLACHSSPNSSVIAAIDIGMSGTTVVCTTCHATYHANQNVIPVANAGSDQTAQAGQSVALSAQNSYDPDGFIASFNWNFGDSTTGSGVNVSKTYNTAGTYTVTLTVTDDKGAIATDTVVITVQASTNKPPVANAGPDQAAQTGQAVSLSGAASSDPDGTITSYSWNFGDNTTGTGVSVSHTYTAAGTYTVTLTVTDSKGATASDTAIITVTSASTNRALNKPASASGSESSYGPSNAVDGNMSTRWWKRSSNTHWIAVDLGNTYSITKVVLNWHDDYARDYEVRTSRDNNSWSTVRSVSGSDGGRDDITFSSTSARYVQIRCTRSYDSGGYSLYEFEVY